MVSDTKKFLFLHINKTAGLSIRHSLKDHSNRKNYPPHETLDELFDQCFFHPSEYFKFTFVRNPWDRMVSHFFYLKSRYRRAIKNQPKWLKKISTWEKVTFKEYIRDGFDNPSYWGKMERSQLDWVTDDSGKVRLDFIGKFENLDKDFDQVCDRVGVKRRRLPRFNPSGHKSYGDHYDKETRGMIAQYYQKEIEFFGYVFKN